MKRIIDIPEEMYDWLDNGFPTEDDYAILWEQIRQGTPLPKGYRRLMDADGFINSLKGIEKLHIDDELRSSLLDIINNNILVEADKGEIK